jgi:hypothetical protein
MTETTPTVETDIVDRLSGIPQGLAQAAAAEITRLRSTSQAGGVPAGWRDISTAPKGRNVLVGYFNSAGKWRTIKAEFVPKHTIETEEEYGNPEDVGEDGTAYVPEGWYESVEAEVDAMHLGCTPSHWMPLPAAPGASPPPPATVDDLASFDPFDPAIAAEATPVSGTDAVAVEREAEIVAAYKRGFEWCVENGPDREYLNKAARDYADKAMSVEGGGNG